MFEPKLDGIRALIAKNQGNVRIFSRAQNDLTKQYPTLVEAIREQPADNVILDGEIIALDSAGRPSFHLLQQRLGLTNKYDIERIEKRLPVYFFAFDILYLEGYMVTGATQANRRSLLLNVIEETTFVRRIPSFDVEGEIAYQVSLEHGFEGVVAKDTRGLYEVGKRSPNWIKLKAHRTADFVVCGYNEGTGSRASTFGALMLGFYENGQLVYCGKAGSGFDNKMVDQMFAELTKRKIDKCPYFRVPPKDKKGSTWCTPDMVAEVKFMDWSDDKVLRHPVFLRIRTDLRPEEITTKSVFGLPDPPIQTPSPATKSESKASSKSVRAEIVSKATDSTPTRTEMLPSVARDHLFADEKSDMVDAWQPPLNSKSVEIDLAEDVGGKSKVSQDDVEAVFNPKIDKVTKESMKVVQLLREEPRRHEAKVAEPTANYTPAVRNLLLQQLAAIKKESHLIVDGERIKFTSLDRVVWRQTDISPPVTKRDLITYLIHLSPLLLPFLSARPLSTKRQPKGYKGEAFFQKHWFSRYYKIQVPEFVDFTELRESGTVREYIVCKHLCTLLWLGQHSALEYHIWASNIGQDFTVNQTFAELAPSVIPPDPLDYPDFLIFDLDIHLDDEEGEQPSVEKVLAAFDKTRAVALVLKEALDALKLKTFVKLSGRTGVHVFLPIVRNMDHSVTRELARTISDFVFKHVGDAATTSAIESKRTGKVLVDHSPNGRGKTIIAPYSPRIWNYPTVSYPLTWEELRTASPFDFRVDTILRHDKCCWREILEQRHDLHAMLSG